MRKVKVLIVEDEVIVAEDIAHYLRELGCEILDIIIAGEKVLPFLQDHQVDFILMDISLRGKLDGIETVHLLKEDYDIPVIYLTANTDDRSFELAKATKPFAFVEKPFVPKKLMRTVELLIESLGDTNQAEVSSEDTISFVLKDRIFVRDKGKMSKILLSDIQYIEADGAYSKIVSEAKTYLIAINLRNLETKISSDILMRVHRSYIINLNNIDSIEDGYIEIQQKSLPVSRTHWKTLLQKLKVI